MHQYHAGVFSVDLIERDPDQLVVRDVGPAGERDLRTCRQHYLGLSPPARSEEVAAVDHRRGQRLAMHQRAYVRAPNMAGVGLELINIRPSFSFNAGGNRVDLYGNYEYTGKRYVDFFHNTALPADGEFGVGVTLTRNSWSFQVTGSNLTGAHGLTESNTRTDNLSRQGTANDVYGRPIFGRNFRIVVSKAW